MSSFFEGRWRGILFLVICQKQFPAGPLNVGALRCACLVVMDNVVIIGCGFGSLSTAQPLKKVPVRLKLLDWRNFIFFNRFVSRERDGLKMLGM
jgi:hypothetical protein